MVDFIDILLSRYRFLLTSEKLLLRDVAGSYDVLADMTLADIERITGRRHKLGSFSLRKMYKDAERAWNILASGRLKCLFCEQTEYPAQLAEIYNPPYMIFYQGSLPDWKKPSVAVVGTRLASGMGLEAAFRLGFELAEYGLPVVSGLAMGIDSSAHRGASAASGVTLAVLGGGADKITPSVNKPVAAKILEKGGAVLSEYLPGEEPRKQNFPERNRLISGLSRSVVVVEAPGKSGALITADFAVEQGRDVFIHSAALQNISVSAGAVGIKGLAFDGAAVISGADEILHEWGLTAADKSRSEEAVEQKAVESRTAGLYMAERMKAELAGNEVKFNGKYFRRACYESSYSIGC